MNENGVNGLAHLYINRDIELDYPDAIDEFSKTTQPTRLGLRRETSIPMIPSFATPLTNSWIHH